MRWLLGLTVLLVLTNVAHAALDSDDSQDVLDFTTSLGTGTRLVLYGLVGLGLALLSIAVPDAPLLIYLFSMSLAQFNGLRVALTLMQCAIVLLKTGAPGNLVPSWALSLFLLCATASGSWALDPGTSFSGELIGISAMLLQLPLTIATMALLRSNLTTLGRLLTALVLGAVPGCILTIRNALAGVRYLDDQGAADQNQYYMGFIAPDIFSTILIMGAIFLLFYLTSAGWSLRKKSLAGLALPLLCVALLLTGIRSSWVAFGLATLLIFIRIRNMWALGGAFLLLMLVGFLSFSDVLGLNLQEKMAARLSEKSLATGEARVQFWQVAAQGFAQRPVLGIGWGCFPGFAADNTVGKAVLTHNVFVRVACELGVVGLLLFGAWIATTALRLRRSTMGGFMGLLMVGVLVQGLFLDHFICSHFWLFLGLCEGIRPNLPFGAGERLGMRQELPVPRPTPLEA